jgi:hypothetical protein
MHGFMFVLVKFAKSLKKSLNFKSLKKEFKKRENFQNPYPSLSLPFSLFFLRPTRFFSS